jgi:hypothetical protein
MAHRLYFALLFLVSAALLAQTPAPEVKTHSSSIGFTYGIPADWEVVDAQATLPSVKEEESKAAATEEEKKGIACVQVALTARHGSPGSVVAIVALPFDCFGQTMTEKDLPGFAAGASEGVKKTFDLSGQMTGAYSLGVHSMWIERSTGTPIGHPELKYTLETVCTVLKKGAVCWMAMMADDGATKTFENGAVTLDGEAPAALVPADAFANKPVQLP